MSGKNSFGSLSLNIMRISFVLILLGLFLPVGCKSSGFQIAEGILGNSKLAKSAIFLSPVDNIYGYILLAVFVLALIGLILTFLGNVNTCFNLSIICLLVSLILLIIILIKFKIYFNFNDFAFYIKIVFPVKLNILTAGYSMIIGYISGIAAFLLNKLRIIE
jgi:hypothetical protein